MARAVPPGFGQAPGRERTPRHHRSSTPHRTLRERRRTATTTATHPGGPRPVDVIRGGV